MLLKNLYFTSYPLFQVTIINITNLKFKGTFEFHNVLRFALMSVEVCWKPDDNVIGMIS